MKRSMQGLMMAMAVFLLLIPIYSQADMKLTIMTTDGRSITTSNQVIKNFFTTSDGATLVVDGGIDFISNTDIGLETLDGTPLGNVINGTVNQQISFKVVSDNATQFSAPIIPETNCTPTPCWSTPNFSWTPTSTGNYLAVFQATANDNTSQIIALIKVNPPGYNLIVNQPTDQKGSITLNPNKTTGFPATAPYETVQVTANPASGYRLASWVGDLSGTANPATLTMNGNKTVSATFELIPATQYTLTVTANPTAGGSITSNGATYTGGSYTQGTPISLQANVNSGYTFSGWSGAVTGTTNPVTFTMPAANASITAIFTSNTTPPTGTGTKDNPLPLITYLAALNGYGYNYNYGQQYPIPRGGTVWFKADPTLISGLTTPSRIKISVFNYDPYGVNVTGALYEVNRSTGAENKVMDIIGSQNLQTTKIIWVYKPEVYYLISLTENGTETQPMSIWWNPF